MLIEATSILVGGKLGLGTKTPDAMVHVYEDNVKVDYTAGITIEQDGAGDAVLHFLLTGGEGYNIGIDNSANDLFIISSNNNPDNSLSYPLLTLDDVGNMYLNTVGSAGGGKISTYAKNSADQIETIFDATLNRGGGNGGVGLGLRYLFRLENGAGAPHDAGKFEVVWTDPADTDEDSSFGISVMKAGSFVEAFQVNSTAIDVDSAMRIGDGGASDYAEIKADGEIHLHGAARVKRQIRIANADLGKGTSAPTQGIIGNYTLWNYGINDDSVFTFYLPNDWAVGTDVVINIDWAINEAYTANSGEVKWEAAWSAAPHDGSEALDAPSDSGSLDTGDIDIPATAKTLTTNGLTISGASLTAGDQVGVTLKRMALTDGSNPAAEPGVVDLNIEYTADKLGEAA